MQQDSRQWLRTETNTRVEQGIFQASDALLLLEGSSTMQDPELAFKICEKLQESSYDMGSLPNALQNLYRTNIYLLRTIKTRPIEVVNLLSTTYAQAKIESAERILNELKTQRNIENDEPLIQAFELLTAADKLLTQENKLCRAVFTQIFQQEILFGSKHKQLVDFLNTKFNLQITFKKSLTDSTDGKIASAAEPVATTKATGKRKLVTHNDQRKKPAPLDSKVLKQQISCDAVPDRDTQSPHQNSQDMMELIP